MAEFNVHPVIERLIAATEGDESVVELRGFIGPEREGDGETRYPCT